MSMEMAYEQALQHQEYVTKGAYHRTLRNRILSAFRYEITLNFLPDNLDNIWTLDFGGGDGMMASLTARRGAKSIVYDQDAQALQLARSADPKLKETTGGVHLPFPDGTFGAITMLETLEHIPNEDESVVISELVRTLAPGGTMILSVPSVNVPKSNKHYRHYSADDLRARFDDVGVTDYQILPYRNLQNPFKDKNEVLRKAMSLVLIGADTLVRNISANNKLGLRGCSEEVAEGFFIVAHKGQEPQSASQI